MGYDLQTQQCTPTPLMCSMDPNLDQSLAEQDEQGNQALLDEIAMCGSEEDPSAGMDLIRDTLEDQACWAEEVAPEDPQICEDPSLLVCEAEDQVSGADQEVCEIEEDLCEIEQTTRPLDQVMGEAMRARGADQTSIDAAWREVQRGSATAYGDYFNATGEAQRSVYSMLDAADTLDGVMPGMGAVIRAAATATLQVQLNMIRTQAIDSVVNSTMCNLGGDQCEMDPCLEAQIRAQVEAQFAAQAFDPATMTGSSQDIRFALTTGMDNQRLAVQRSLEGMSGTQFQQRISGDANGLQMTMLTQGDYNTQLATDEATGNAQVDAGHLHATGVAANGQTANENMQTMLRDMYKTQTTSNVGRTLTDQLVAGTGQQFDTRFIANNQSGDIQGDSFLTNGVDVHDLHDPAMVPDRVAAPGDRGAIDVQSSGSAYVHFMAERQSDAQANPTDMTAIAANDTALTGQGQALDVQRQALVAQLATLSAAEQASIQTGGGATTPAGQAFVAAYTPWNAAQTTWQTSYNAHLATFNNRINPAHAHGIAMENDYNREQGLLPTARP